MTTIDPNRTPVIAAATQAVERDETVSPLDLLERASRAALDRAPGLARRVERVSVVSIVFSNGGTAPATALARRLRLQPDCCEVTTVGGNVPQWLVSRAAAAISEGQLTATLIAGAEAMRSAKRATEPLEVESNGTDPVVGDVREGVGPAELAIGLVVPSHVYPMFESAIAARAGRSYAEHRTALGEFMAPYTRVAAGNPFAWFQRELAPHEISTPSPENRVVAEPYTKLMTAFPAVDQAAALLVTSLAAAREAGLDDESIFVWSGADANDVLLPVARPDLGTSPGIGVAVGAALAAASLELDEVDAFDFYSCFPCAVEMAAGAIGLALDDPRGLTVTGGLPYFGGPGNNFTTHSIASMVDLLRDRSGIGLVTGLGYYVTKHAVGIYGSRPPSEGFRLGDTSAGQAAIDASTLPVALEVDGVAAVEASTVVYDHAGRPTAAPVIARMADGRRVAAAVVPEHLDQLAGVNLVDARIRVRGSPPAYVVEAAS